MWRATHDKKLRPVWGVDSGGLGLVAWPRENIGGCLAVHQDNPSGSSGFGVWELVFGVWDLGCGDLGLRD